MTGNGWEMNGSVLDDINDICVAFDETGALVDWNRATSEVTGCTDAELAASALEDLFGGVVARTDIPSEVRESGALTVEADVLTADGTRRRYELKVHRVPDGDPAEFVGIARDIADRAARERELEQQAERMEAFSIGFPDLAFVVSENGRYLDVLAGDRSEELLYGGPSSFLGQFAHDVLPDDQADEHVSVIRASIDAGESRQHEYSLEVADETRWFDARIEPLPFRIEGTNAAVWVARDVTDRKAFERRLQAERRFVHGIFDAIPDPLYAFDTERRLIRWNERLATVTGYSDAELDGMDIIELLADDEAEPVRSAIRTALSERRPMTVESALETAVGERVPYEFTGGPLEDGDGEFRGITGIGRDLTAHKEHERRLTALNEVSHDLMAADTRAAVAEIGVDAARDIVGLDLNAIHLYDADRSGLAPVAATDAVYDLVGDPPVFTGGNSIAWRAYERGETITLDDIRDDPDRHNPETSIRSELYFAVGEYGVFLAGSTTTEAFEHDEIALGKLLANSVTAALEQLDRTERLRTSERELARQNERLEEFASVVSHDLRGPLSVASGRLELARAEVDSEHLDAAADAHGRMRTLIDDLLALAREGEAAGSTEPVDVGDLAERCWRNIDTAEGTLEIEIDRTIDADRSRLQQLLENLIGNAVEHGSISPDSHTRQDAVEHGSTGPRSQPHGDATEDGSAGSDPKDGDGTVTVTIGELGDGFYVADDGPGVPEADREGIFEVGYSTAEDGTGFGLSIVERVADAHGWDVRVTDSADGGARFEITGVELE